MKNKEYYLLYAELDEFKGKIELVKSSIEKETRNTKGSISYSTGKDSLVMLDIALEANPNLDIMFHDSWYELPESYGIIKLAEKHHNKTINVVKSPIDILDEYAKKKAFYDAGCKNYAFEKAMMTPIRNFQQDNDYKIALIGIRKEESKRRENLIKHMGKLFYSKKNKIYQFYPICDLTGDDVFAYIYSRKLDKLLHPAYNKTRFTDDPAKIRISWFVDPTAATIGQFSWLKYYYKKQYNLMLSFHPEIKAYT